MSRSWRVFARHVRELGRWGTTRGRRRSWKRVRWLERKLKKNDAVVDWGIGEVDDGTPNANVRNFVQKKLDQQLRGFIGQVNTEDAKSSIKQAVKATLHHMEQQGVIRAWDVDVDVDESGTVKADVRYQEIARIGDMKLRIVV